MRKLLIVAALVGVAISSVPGVAGAACEVPRTEDGLRRANVVFVGTVESVTNDDRTAVFDVQWVWKGKDVEERVTVYGESTDEAAVSGDDRRFQVGITYLVASTTAAPPYRSDRCTATRFWQEAGSVIPVAYRDAFGNTAPTKPIPVTVAAETSNVLDNPLVPIGTGVVVAALLIFAIGRVFRGPEHVARPSRGSRRRRLGGSRLPTLGRSGEGFSGGFRRSGVSQAQKLRGKRRRGRKRSKKVKAKSTKGGLRTDRLEAPSEGDADADAGEPRVNA